MFCVRNKNREQWQKDFKERTGKEMKQWYDGSPVVSYPMDSYHSLDMKKQFQMWGYPTDDPATIMRIEAEKAKNRE